MTYANKQLMKMVIFVALAGFLLGIVLDQLFP